MPTGANVFVTTEGVQYLIDKYLSSSDKDELRNINTPYSQERFRRTLIDMLERSSGNKSWIPSNYDDDLVENASAIIGTNKTHRRTKKGDDVEVYTTRSGQEVYEDKRGRMRHFGTGRYARTSVFEE